MKNIWVATADSRHFSFEAYGSRDVTARKALERGLRLHAKQCAADSTWVAEMMDSAEVRRVVIGAAYRDREPIGPEMVESA